MLTDFGLARAADDVTLTRWGVIAGTPQYMSPEQARGEPLDCRSDLFSLGSVLYEMATGVSPFRTDSMLATLRRLVDDAPKAMASLNPELPPWFIAIVNRLLEKDPAKRFNSAKEVSELLEGCLAHMQQPASVPLPASLPVVTKNRAGWRKFMFSYKGVLTMMAAIGIGLLGVLLASFEPPDISGEWSGDEWGRVVLKKTTDGEYTGTFSDTVGKQPGEIQLKWSRIERRFNGTWREGEDRLGEISVRVANSVNNANSPNNEIRGAFTTDPKSKINPATPRLADLAWSRPTAIAGNGNAPNGQKSPVGNEILGSDPPLSTVTYRETKHMRSQLARSDATLKEMSSKVTTLQAEPFRAEELRVMQIDMGELQAAHRDLKESLRKFESIIAQRKSGDMSNSDFVKSQNECAQAEVRLRAVQSWAQREEKWGAFGPVVEQIVPANDESPWPWFDIDKGKVIAKGEDDDFDVADFSATFNKAGGCQLSTADRSGFGSVEINDHDWEKITSDALASWIHHSCGAEVLYKDTKKNWTSKTFAFLTRSGGMGILQIMGISEMPRGVKIRYKLLQSTAKKPAAVDPPEDTETKSTFGSVVEREIPFHGACLNLTTGKLTPMSELPLATEARKLHGDVFQPATENDLNALTILDVKLLELDSKALSDLSATALEEKFTQQAADHKTSQPRSETRIPPGVYGFKTFDKTGLLQVLGIAKPDALTGVKLRYKLVEKNEKKAAVVDKTTSNTKPHFGPAMERVLPQGVPCRAQYFQFHSGNVFIVGNGPGTSKEEAALDEKNIEDAGGVDMSATSSADQFFIEGRGCIFKRDSEKLKWDTFTAEQVAKEMQRVRHIDSEVTPMKKELPLTYLFKTARGEVGMMEVLGVAGEKKDGWTENGMKFRYKLVQGSETTATPPLIYGEGTQGLQAALEVTPGEPFKLRIYIRNVSDHAISIDGASYRQNDECLLTDASGQPVPVTKVSHEIGIGMKGGYFGAGQVAVFESAGLSFQAPTKDGAFSFDTAKNLPSIAGYVAQVKPGRYTLRVRLRLPGDDVPFAPGDHVWKGELETGPVTIEVKDPGTYPVVPVADEIWSSILGPAIEKTVNDLQTTHENCALSLDSGKLLPVPKNITLDTLTNPKMQDEALKWASDNHVDGIAFVTTAGGKVVKCGLLCPGLVVLRANNAEWDPNTADSRMLKEDFEEAMHDWNFIPQIAEVTCDDHFPANYLILDTRTHRRGVLQILGVAEKPSGVKIRYRLVEGAPLKKTASKGMALPIQTSRLQFRLVAKKDDKNAMDVTSHDGKQPYRLQRDVLLDEAAVVDAKVSTDANGTSIIVALSEAGAKRFAEITGANIDKQLAIVFDGKVLSAPIIRSAISGGQAQITGSFTPAEAEAIAKILAPSDDAKLSVTKEQIELIEKLLKAAPVTTDYLAELFEHDPTSRSSYRVRPDVVSHPILPAGKPPLEAIPLGEVLSLPGGSFYVQWDDLGASTLHYYGPFTSNCEAAEKLGLSRSKTPTLIAPKHAPVADPLQEIELKVAQQQLEKALNDLQDLQTEMALLPAKTGLSEAEQKAEVAKLELKQNVLREQAAQLREAILRNMRSQK